MTPIQQKKIIKSIQEKLEQQFRDEPSGHDWWHIYRVQMMAQRLSTETNQPHNRFVVELGALLHDVADWKFHDGDDNVGPQKAETLLKELGVEDEIIQAVKLIIKEISFKGAGVPTPMSTLEGEIVQDADRLDAIGAIGVARAFAYGGFQHRPMHDPQHQAHNHQSFEDYKNHQGTTINHFYEKLLLLKERLNTEPAKQIAAHRHQYLENYLAEFLAEWEAKK